MMHIERYENPVTKEVTYTLKVPTEDVRADQVFIDSMDEKTLVAVEASIAEKLFYRHFARLQEMHRNGTLPLIEYKGGGTE